MARPKPVGWNLPWPQWYLAFLRSDTAAGLAKRYPCIDRRAVTMWHRAVRRGDIPAFLSSKNAAMFAGMGYDPNEIPFREASREIDNEERVVLDGRTDAEKEEIPKRVELYRYRWRKHRNILTGERLRKVDWRGLRRRVASESCGTLTGERIAG